MNPCTGVILAGGLNTRFNGHPKALVSVGGEPILSRVYGVFRELFDEILLVVNEPIFYLDWDIHIVTDLFSVRSSLTGIHTGLFYANQPHVFFTACDAPFLKKELVETIVRALRPGFYAAVPATSAGLEPLCAVYSKQCQKLVEQNIKRNQFKIQRVFRDSRILKIPETTLRKDDSNLNSFFNVNTPVDLIQAEAMTKHSVS